MRVKTKAEIYRQSNEECARIILADPERYSAGSLLAIWAARILEQSGVVPTERQAEVQHDTVSREEIQERA